MSDKQDVLQYESQAAKPDRICPTLIKRNLPVADRGDRSAVSSLKRSRNSFGLGANVRQIYSMNDCRSRKKPARCAGSSFFVRDRFLAYCQTFRTNVNRRPLEASRMQPDKSTTAGLAVLKPWATPWKGRHTGRDFGFRGEFIFGSLVCGTFKSPRSGAIFGGSIAATLLRHSGTAPKVWLHYVSRMTQCQLLRFPRFHSSISAWCPLLRTSGTGYSFPFHFKTSGRV